MPTITPDSRNLINSRTSLKPEGSTTKDPSKPIGPHRGDRVRAGKSSLKPEGSTTKDPSKPTGPHRGVALAEPDGKTNLKPEGSTTKDPSKPIGPHRGDGPLSVPAEPKKPRQPVMRGG